jgi:hypothetical protein
MISPRAWSNPPNLFHHGNARDTSPNKEPSRPGRGRHPFQGQPYPGADRVFPLRNLPDNLLQVSGTDRYPSCM